MVDDLEYQYAGNRLTKVIENIPNSTGYEGGNNIIDYDLNGSMINMKDKGIQGIAYNHLNLPDNFSITQVDPLSGNSTSFGLGYLYRADGVKVRKTYSTGGGRMPSTYKYTDYLDGFQYIFSETVQPCPWCRTSVAYEQEAFRDPVLIDPTPVALGWQLDFVPTAEGFYSFTENRYIYQYRDYLGNARVNYAKDSQGNLQIKDTNNYYAFGMNHIGGMKSMLGGYKSYKYNGKEIQESGMYDYGARFYMPDIGRWGVVDPLAELQFKYSPYSYVYNNPIRYADPTGMIGEDPDPKKVYGPKGGQPIEEVVMTYTRPSSLSFMGINNLAAYHASEDRLAAGIRGSNAALATEKFERNLAFAMGTFIMGGSNIVASAGWATLDTIIDYQDAEDQEAIQAVQLAAIAIQVKHGNVKGLQNLASEAEEIATKLPSLDATGKVHGTLPKVKDLINYSKEDLKILLKELKNSVQKRIEVTSQLGRDRPHGQRQGAEQDLIKSIEKHLGK
ncbi:RHS repeat-associated core domain-containing protein [Chryseobacterium sp. JJR-5R]|uniref:RHS repeat-associated core domain-containing protein n=1 Tax=Chryseobacterium sp. JJR-5R TaxID=3093923 RepID=UPI002A7647AF|nr:RHS repeat-associated core domain-containing protein [Chryseobacterium sp. JJR-5R]WPO83353.1 RHS repeat-associated core domain-containing protein [Chryseobacterium sp. JJR-5R]